VGHAWVADIEPLNHLDQSAKADEMLGRGCLSQNGLGWGVREEKKGGFGSMASFKGRK